MKMIKTQIFDEKYNNIKQHYFLYCELTTWTRDVTYLKQRYRENIGDKKLSVEFITCGYLFIYLSIDMFYYQHQVPILHLVLWPVRKIVNKFINKLIKCAVIVPK